MSSSVLSCLSCCQVREQASERRASVLQESRRVSQALYERQHQGHVRVQAEVEGVRLRIGV